MRFKVGSTSDDYSVGSIDVGGILNAYKDRGPCDFYKYGGQAVAATRYAQVSFSLDDDEDGEWREVEKMGPSGNDLIKLIKRFPAPRGWD
jgi:hypothetical protein